MHLRVHLHVCNHHWIHWVKKKMLQLLCTQPESAVSISTNAKISVALMKRTDSVCDEAGSSSQGNIPVVALTPRPRSAGTDGFFYAEIQDLSASSCFVHAQSRSDSGARWQVFLRCSIYWYLRDQFALSKC